ncbi:phage tail protein [Diplocloster modestus]|uniref:Tail spike domain-containing protein n=1 Tax=Diplocloster modestus TaxID=2850322 RepID=A0ABS6KEL1_9FIRM|nr:phage tail protein [Diplocloster modestus]MBU9728950.1 hypothetical protein [Diplocloster modestus]
MPYPFHLYDMPDPPALYLCEVDKEILGALPATGINLTRKFNDIDEITFQVPREYTDIYGTKILTPLYEKIEALRLIYIENFGYFEIQEPSIEKDAVSEHKECTAYSLQYELTKKKLKSFYINLYNGEDIDGVELWNIDHSKSLLHLCLEKFPQWNIGNVDSSIREHKRSFEIEEQDVYSFLTKDVADTFGCVFVFNTITNTIEVYAEDNIGEDTSIYISYENLANTVSVNYNADDIVTSLTILGADDLDVRNLNMGQDSVLDLSYYHTPEWMGQELYDAWNVYLDKFNSRTEEYRNLATQVDTKYLEVYELINRAPAPDAKEGDWTKYGREALLTAIKSLEITNSNKRDLGWSDPQNKNYKKYKDEFDKLNAAKEALKNRNIEIDAVNEAIQQLLKQMNEIAAAVHWKNILTPEQQKKITRFIREDTWQDSNFVVTDNESPAEEDKTRKELLAYGKKYLSKISRPQLTFSMDISNIFALKEFEPLAGRFEVGNYIHVTLRENYSFLVRLLQYTISFDNPSEFTCEFGNAARSKSEFDNHSDLLEQAVTSGKTVADWKSYWQKSADKITEIDHMIKDGLDTAVTSIHSASNRNDITIDETGIHLRMLEEDGSYSTCEAVLTGNKLLYSDDNMATAKTGLGQFEIEGQKFYGLLADAVLSGYVGASHLVGNEISNGNNFTVSTDGAVTAKKITILGGTITWDEVNKPENMATKDELPKVPDYLKSTYISATELHSPNIIGGHLKIINSSGTISSEITTDGKLTATGATISGNLTATGGTIGGWKITSDSISSNDVFISSNPSKYAFAAGGHNPDGTDALTRIGHNGQFYTQDAIINGNTETAAKCIIYNSDQSYRTDMFGGGFHIYRSGDINKDIVTKVSTNSLVVKNGKEETQVHSQFVSVLDNGNGTIYTTDGPEKRSGAELKSNFFIPDNLLDDVLNTDVYSYNYNSSLARGVDYTTYGFVIGDGYKTSNKILSKDGQRINMYSSIGVLWGGVKELAAKVSALEEKINQLTAPQTITQPTKTPPTNQEVK